MSEAGVDLEYTEVGFRVVRVQFDLPPHSRGRVRGVDRECGCLEDLYYTEESWEQQFPNRDYPKNLAEIIVAKHRHGPTGSVKMRFRDSLVRFDALEVDDV